MNGHIVEVVVVPRSSLPHTLDPAAAMQLKPCMQTAAEFVRYLADYISCFQAGCGLHEHAARAA